MERGFTNHLDIYESSIGGGGGVEHEKFPDRALWSISLLEGKRFYSWQERWYWKCTTTSNGIQAMFEILNVRFKIERHL